MDGAASDLRTGLPWQMVEIHEPVRSLFIIETTPEAMLRIMDRNEGIGRLCRNGWVQLAVLDPEIARDQRLPGRRVPALPAAGRRCCPRRPRPSTGIAAGATTWNSPRSKPEACACGTSRSDARPRVDAMTADIRHVHDVSWDWSSSVSPLVADDRPRDLVAARLEARRGDDGASWSTRRSSPACWRRSPCWRSMLVAGNAARRRSTWATGS